MSTRCVLGLCTVIAVIGIGCGSSGLLGEYDFRDRTVAAVHDFPPYPEVFTGPYFPGHPERPVHFILQAGSRLAKEIEAEEVRTKLDSAAILIDVADRIAERSLHRAASFMRARPVEDSYSADYVLDMRIRDYGIDAQSWEAAAHFFIDAEITLLDGFDGLEIWRTRVRQRDTLTPLIFGDHAITRDIITAQAFAALSVDDIARALDRLADYCADHLTDHLRDGLQKAQRDNPVTS